jgi:hypothetical protein
VLQAALTIVSLGGLYRVPEHNGRSQQDRANGHARHHDGDNGPVEGENEAEDEYCDGDRKEQIPDAVGEQGPLRDLGPTFTDGVTRVLHSQEGRGRCRT